MAMPYACCAFSIELWRIVTCCVVRATGQWPSWMPSHWFVPARFVIRLFSTTT